MMLTQLLQRVWNPSIPVNTGKTIPLHPTHFLPERQLTTTGLDQPINTLTRTAKKLTLVTTGTNQKYYEMCENADNTFTVYYGRVGGIRSTVTYPMGQWQKKLQDKVAQGYKENVAINPVTDPYTLRLIGRMMGANVNRLAAVFSMSDAASDQAFNAYVRQQISRKTLALWHGNFQENGYLALYEVHVGGQLCVGQQEPRYMRLTTDALRQVTHERAWTLVQQNEGSLQKDEFVVQNLAQCTIRYIVSIRA